jgi:hypothetical protein
VVDRIQTIIIVEVDTSPEYYCKVVCSSPYAEYFSDIIHVTFLKDSTTEYPASEVT